MSTSAETFKLIRLQQGASALAKDLTISVGWRPAMAWVFNYKAAGVMAMAIDGEAVAGGLTFGANAAMAAAADAITFHDKGIKLGAHATLVREDAAEIIVMLFRDLYPSGRIAVDSELPTTPSAFGTGKQFTEAGLALSAQVSVTQDA